MSMKELVQKHAKKKKSKVLNIEFHEAPYL